MRSKACTHKTNNNNKKTQRAKCDRKPIINFMLSTTTITVNNKSRRKETLFNPMSPGLLLAARKNVQCSRKCHSICQLVFQQTSHHVGIHWSCFFFKRVKVNLVKGFCTIHHGTINHRRDVQDPLQARTTQRQRQTHLDHETES